MEFVKFFKYYASIYIILIFQINNTPMFQLSLTDSFNVSTIANFEIHQPTLNNPNQPLQQNFQHFDSPTIFQHNFQQTPSPIIQNIPPETTNFQHFDSPAIFQQTPSPIIQNIPLETTNQFINGNSTTWETEEQLLPWNENDGQVLSPRTLTKLLSINVQCFFNSMKVFIKFDGPFHGVIYSKDHFHLPACHYVPFRSGQSEFQFQLSVDQCGVKFVNDEASSKNPMLEDTIIVQNEEEIQEIWDTAQHIRCKSPEMKKKIINTAFHVELNDPIEVTYVENKVNAFMDIQLGRGPNAAPVTGMVKIGATLTLVVTVVAVEEIDIQVKDCLAHNGDLKSNNQTRPTEIRMSDTNGCILKPQLLTTWRKTIEKDGNSGVKATAYTFLQAFKFPDKLEVHFECNIEICNRQCHASNCDLHDHSIVKRSEDVLEEVRLQRSLKVVSNEDFKSIQNITENDVGLDQEPKMSKNVCLTLMEFIITIIVIFISFVLIAFAIISAIVSLRKNLKQQIATAVLMDRFAVLESLSRYKN